MNEKQVNPIDGKGVNYLLNPIKERDENAMFVVNFYKRFIIDKSEFPKKYLTKVLCKYDSNFINEDKITTFDASIVTPEKSMLFIQPIIFGKCP